MRVHYQLKALAMALLSGAALTACVDNNYDLSKDVDLTVGIGSDGLSLKLGSTEKIFLKDVLKVEDSDMLDTTATSLYYLTKEGSAEVNVDVSRIDPFKVDDVHLSTTETLVEAPADHALPVTAGNSYPAKELGAEKDMDILITDIEADVKEVQSIIPYPVTMTADLAIEQPAGAKFAFDKISDLTVEFPEFVYSKDFEPGTHTYKAANNATHLVVDIDSIVLPLSEGARYGTLVKDGKIELNGPVVMNGTFRVKANSDFTLAPGESVKIKMTVSFPNIEPREIAGLVDPEIAPEVDPIEISNDLPDFLQDDNVTLQMANPTIKFMTQHGEDLPIPLLFSANLQSSKDENVIANVFIPGESSQVEIPDHRNSLFYFYQDEDEGPFDPEEVSGDAEKYLVENLSDLVTRLPDRINIDLKGKKVAADPAKLHRVELGRTYNIAMDYTVLVPFEFNKDLCIVYTDSIDNLSEDLKDYQADGMTITAQAVNYIPLDMEVSATPLDIHGNELNITVESDVIKAAANGSGTTTDVTITLKAGNPKEVSKLDKLYMKVKASSVASDQLNSNQYVELKDLRLKLNGQIIGNFN